ncbi:MAG: hypothetical protein ACOVO2_07285 [Emticicia sp.]|uniref:hypothetical protein n=1 Tax=Emticicia sp. TaxID=1930953 RepID=UPI003BA74DCA
MKRIITGFAISTLLTFNLVAQESPKSKVVFFRTFNFFGGAIGFNVFSDTTKVMRFKPQTFKIVDVEPKPIRLWAETEVKRHVDIDFKSNHIYFVRGKVGMGLFVGRPQFETLTVDEFRDLVSKKKYLQKQLKNAGYNNVDDLVKPFETLKFTSL